MTAKKAKRKAKAGNTTAAGSVRVRMYRSGLGDCFLLTFPRQNDAPFHMLIDCGVFFRTPNEKQRMRDIAADIRTATGGTIDVLVGTHEHYDHLIGFKHARDIFESMTIKEVWLSWTDKPDEPRAAWLRALENRLKLGLQLALQQALDTSDMKARARGLHSILQFGGDPLAADYSEQLGDVKRWLRESLTPSVQYLEPHGAAIELLPGVRVYPLGPPLKESFFRQMNDSKVSAETYRTQLAYNVVPAFRSLPPPPIVMQLVTQKDMESLAFPFEKRWKIDERAAKTWRTPLTPEAHASGKKGAVFFAERYGFAPQDASAWRRIDDDWLDEAENIALQLDSLTNNSSLALAIEVGSARRVILMAADAQVGNWLSWHDGTWTARSENGNSISVRARDLLERTVLYKVGHHGSHNATLKQKGLEMMTHKELVAMIPVDEHFARNSKGWEMPFPGIFSELKKRTKGRVIRADNGLPATSDVEVPEQTAFFADATQTPLYCDYSIPM